MLIIMKKNVLYLFPAFLDHPGLKRKVDGQCHGMTALFNCTLYALSSSKTKPKWHQFLSYFIYTFKALIKTKDYEIIYCRYNAKFICLFLKLACLSFKKPVIIEINGDYLSELSFLNRRLELWCHQKLMKKFLNSKAHLAFSNTTIYKAVKAVHPNPSQVHVLQNGYLQNKTPLSDMELTQLKTLQKTIESLKKPSIKVAALVSGVPGPRTVDMLQILSHYPDIKVISIGNNPFKNICPIIHHIPPISPRLLDALLPSFDYGLAPRYRHEIGFTGGSALTTGAYLANGLAVITDYDDSLSTTTLAPYLINLKKCPTELEEWLTIPKDKSTIASKAAQVLNWTEIICSLIKKAC